jgi:hypothetical protein
VQPQGGNFKALNAAFNTLEPYELTCPTGTVMTGLTITTALGVVKGDTRGVNQKVSDNAVESLGAIQCTGPGTTYIGTSTAPSPLPNAQLFLPNRNTFFLQALGPPPGYVGMYVGAGFIWDGVALFKADGGDQPDVGLVGGFEGNPYTLVCPAGHVIMSSHDCLVRHCTPYRRESAGS